MIKKELAVVFSNKEDYGNGGDNPLKIEEKTVSAIHESGITEINLSDGYIVQDPLTG